MQAHIWTQKKQVYLVSSQSHVVLHKQSAPHISVHRLFKKGGVGKAWHHDTAGHRQLSAWHLSFTCETRCLRPLLQGGFEEEGQAGRAHDVMALKCRGEDGPLNRPAGEYAPLRPLLDSLTTVRAFCSKHRR